MLKTKLKTKLKIRTKDTKKDKKIISRFILEKSDSRKIAKWYVIKIDHTRESYIIRQLDELIESNILIQYKKASELSGNLIHKYRLMFIKIILTNNNFQIINKMMHVYGFYPSNSNFMSIKDIETYQTKNIKLEQKKIEKLSKTNVDDTDFIEGQYVTIKNGFFAGNNGKIISVIGNSVNVEVEFYDNTLITTEVDISNLVINK